MEARMKDVRRSFLALFGVALVVAVVGRIGLAVMDLAGVLTYDYIAASTGTLLNQVCSALTGPALVAFMALGGMVCALAVAAPMLYGYWFQRGARKLGGFGPALAAGGAVTVAGLVCALVFASGIMSAVQLASMKTKLVLDGGMALMGVAFLAAIVTLNAAACAVMAMCAVRAERGRGSLAANVLVTAAVCGLVVMAFAVPTLATINVAHLDGLVCAGWLVLDTVANLVLLGVAVRLARPASAQEAK